MLTRTIAFVVTLVAAFAVSSEAFCAPRPVLSTVTTQNTNSAIFAFGKKKEDLSFMETRDMTRDEMLDLNQKNEEIMNMELQMKTGFSAVISVPILYLCWVAFFSD